MEKSASGSHGRFRLHLGEEGNGRQHRSRTERSMLNRAKRAAGRVDIVFALLREPRTTLV